MVLNVLPRMLTVLASPVWLCALVLVWLVVWLGDGGEVAVRVEIRLVCALLGRRVGLVLVVLLAVLLLLLLWLKACLLWLLECRVSS